MLSWQFQIDPYFAAILDSALCNCIEQLSDYLQDQLADTIATADVFCLVETRSWQMFESSELLGELQKLLTAHRSAKLFMPIDYHFLILHEVLQLQISHHNPLYLGG